MKIYNYTFFIKKVEVVNKIAWLKIEINPFL